MDLLINLQAMQDRFMDAEKLNAFNHDLAAFKSENIRITKDKYNAQYKSRYASLGNLVDTVTPYLSKHNLSFRWDLENTTSEVKVICILMHSEGHSVSVPMNAPPDGSGSKNLIQQSKSTITYLRACTLECILGVAATDASLDDDGNGSGNPRTKKIGMSDGNTDKSIELHIKKMHSATNMTDLQDAFNSAYKSSESESDRDIFIRHKEEMKKALGGSK